jgi:hypothetical protein
MFLSIGNRVTEKSGRGEKEFEKKKKLNNNNNKNPYCSE